MSGKLDKPLGKQNKKGKSGQDIARRGWRSLVEFRKGPLPLTRILFALTFALIALILSVIVFVTDRDGGRPSVKVQISTQQLDNDAIKNLTNQSKIEESEEKPTKKTKIENKDGVKIITLGDDIPSDIGQSSTGIGAINEFGVNVDLIEDTPNGPIPIISKDGLTPFMAYQRPSITPKTAGDKKLIAIIITGIGLSEIGTIDAIEKLPGAITLAFAPYGRTLQRTSAAAREGGHEILLSIPLEPFDYPDNDPGPQTLLTDQPIRANLDRLFWLMARIGGYIGVINHTGAKFTASAKDFTPIMEELSVRGLGYVDDGSSKRSIAPNLAGNNKVPFARAQIKIDETLSRAAILNRLSELENLANKNGYAIGIASAFPVSIETIAEWSKNLEKKNIVLVPISALMTRP